ncbi:MAG: MG2 domain-containing protein, partial [Bacteroidota bacterium]
DGHLSAAVTDLRTAEPVSGVRLEFYDYQQQLIDVTGTDENGFAQTILERDPFVVVANQGTKKGYLRMLDPNALSLSKFDVGGTVAQKGLKGFLYGDRGVWRPGDSLFLNFVLEDKAGKLPLNYPISFELKDARGQMQDKRTTSENVKNVYPLVVATSADAPTGNWTATVRAGGATFSKTLKVETVKPNRLKINLDFGKEQLSAADERLSGQLQVNWLHGAPAQNLRSVVEMQLRSSRTSFDKYGQYVFDDPTRSFSSSPKVIFDSNVDGNGAATINATLSTNRAAPGKLMASFKTRAFEKGGDFSADNFSMPFYPYESFVGVNVPVNKYGSKEIDMNKPAEMSFVAVDENGKALANRNLEATLYRVNWRWWWDRGIDDLSNYNSSENRQYKQEKTITTNSRGEANWTLSVNRWGRYLVRICDTESGHCTGDKFYAGYPWYDDGGTNQEAAAMLAFSTDKQKYAVGDNVELMIPTGEEGRVLVSIENGSKVVESFWAQAKKGENVINFKATEAMTPTVYANISLVQPHGQVQNDLPIRMYGVVPIQVENPETRLQPELRMASELKPEQEFTIEVTEQNDRPMAYTIAVVDDGLLDLTRFKTPDPWNTFYAREALGVKTWDVYDQVLGAYGGDLERILSIGGDGDVEAEDNPQANRFKPVVMHLGPFEIGRGGKGRHKLTMPNYVGSVRA